MAQHPLPTAITTAVQSWMTSAPPISTTQPSYFSQATGSDVTPNIPLPQRNLFGIDPVYVEPTSVDSYDIPIFLDPRLDKSGENECNLSAAIRQSCSHPVDTYDAESNQALIEYLCRLNQLATVRHGKGPRWNLQQITWVNQHDVYGNTPLKYAARYGVLSAIKPLITAGATPLREIGKTSLHEALFQNKRYTDVTRIQVLQEILVALHDVAPDSLGDVINKYAVELPKYDDGKIITDVCLLQKRGYTVLQAVLGDTSINLPKTQELVRLLLYFGANPLLLNEKDETAIDMACEFEDLEQTTILQDLLNAVPTSELDRIKVSPKHQTRAQMETIQTKINIRKAPLLTTLESQPVASGGLATAPFADQPTQALSSKASRSSITSTSSHWQPEVSCPPVPPYKTDSAAMPPPATVPSLLTEGFTQPSSSVIGVTGSELSSLESLQAVPPEAIFGSPASSAIVSQPTPSCTVETTIAEESQQLQTPIPIFVEQGSSEQESLEQGNTEQSYKPHCSPISPATPQAQMSSYFSGTWVGEAVRRQEPWPVPTAPSFTLQDPRPRQPTHTISKAPESDTETESVSQATEEEPADGTSEQDLARLQPKKFSMRLAFKRSLSEQGKPLTDEEIKQIAAIEDIDDAPCATADDTESDTVDEAKTPPPKRKRGRPRKKASQETTVTQPSTQGKRTLVLDFLIEELQKGDLIYWQKMMEHGTFVMNQDVHEKIATRWGMKNPKETKDPMNYAKFARLLRQKYESGIIEHLTIAGQEQKSSFRSPYYKINIHHEDVKPFITKHGVKF
ncbi:ETS domain-containing protein [Kistimonas asteriae]|uniref:ETS domain-containing protein n=1 Tax=Kistimonas asteriae TaxID=517724 RepID=UPI001BA8204D|nr:ETS domain-containing protein [Kistimonas asteriae]